MEKFIKSCVSDAVSSVMKSDQESITPDQLTEIISKSLTACLLSDTFGSYLDRVLGEKL